MRSVLGSLFLTTSILALAACGRDSGGGSDDAQAAQTPAQTESAGAASADRAEDARFAHEASDVSVDDDVRYGELPNGMRYAILENDTPEGTAALRLHISMGSLAETEAQRGLFHFLEHMAFNGSKNVPEGEMVKILERHGLAFGADTNAFTGFDQTAYLLDVPNVAPEVMDDAFLLIDEVTNNLTLDPEAIDRERGVVVSEERFRNTPGLRSFVDFIATAFPETIIADRLPIGTVDVIENAPREEFVDIYENFYVPERALFVVVGDVDADAVEERIRETFSDWEQPENAKDDPDVGDVNGFNTVTADYFQDPDVPTQISITIPKASEDLPDTLENRRKELVRSIANDIVSRRLSTLARSEDAPFLQGGANYSELVDPVEYAQIALTAEPQNWRPALEVAEQELRRALEHGFTEAELREQIANRAAALKNAADGADTRQNAQLANAIFSAHHAGRVFDHPSDALARFEEFAPQITTELVHNAFIEAFSGSEPLVRVSTSLEIENAEAAILAAYGDSRETPVEAPEEKGDVEFAYDDFGTPGEVVSDERIESVDARAVRFANNVRLTVKKTDLEKDRVRVAFRVGGGLLEFPKDKPGLNILASNGFVNGGLEAHSIDELQSLLAGRTVTPSFGAGEDAFGGQAATTREDLKLQLQLWAAAITAPGYRPEGLAQFRQLINVFVPTLDATPQGIQQSEVPRLLRSGDGRFGIPGLEELQAVDYDDLRQAFDRAFREGLIEIAIVGDIDEDDAVQAVAETLGALPERRAKRAKFPEGDDVAFPEGGGDPVTLRHAGEANRAVALTYWSATDNSDPAETRRIRLMQRVLSLKLIDKVREEIGATYSPASFASLSDTFEGYGFIAVSLDIEPDVVDELYAVVNDIAAAMGAGDISDDEIQRARQPILEALEEQSEQNPFWLNLLAQAQTDPGRIDRFLEAEEGYRAITREEIVATAGKYMDPDTAYRIQILPPATN